MSDSGRSQKKKPEHNVLVKGAIEVNPPHSLISKHDAQRKEDISKRKDERREDTLWETKKHRLEKWTLVAIIVYATITAVQAYLTNRSLTDQRNALHVQQRPWIAVGTKTATIDDVPVEEGKQPIFYTYIENFGNTPAWNETTIDNIDLRCPNVDFLHDHFFDNPPDMPRWTGAKVSANTVMPHDSAPPRTGGVGIPAFTAQDIANLSTGRCVLFYYGRSTFCDIFNHAHWRHFCSQYLPGTKNSMRVCSEYNDGDEDHPELPLQSCSKQSR